MVIYESIKRESKVLNINNFESTRLVVYINDIVFCDINLEKGSEEYPYLKILELNLNEGDVVSAIDNDLITYTIS